MSSRLASGFLLTILSSPLLGGSGLAPERLVYPQMAIGGGFETILQLTNSASVSWSGVLKVPEFAGQAVHWNVNGLDLTGQDSLDIQLEAWETASYRLEREDAEEAISASLWIESASPDSRLASSFYYRYQIDGELVDEVSVAPAEASQRITFPVEIDQGLQLNTGVALRFAASEGDAAQGSAEASFRALLVSQQGFLLATVEHVAPGAQFIDQLFPYDFGASFLGSVILEAQQPFHATVLHQRLLPEGRFQLTGVEPISTAETAPDTETALYQVTFEATWSSSTHPNSFPLGAHFSSLVGGTHNSQAVFWELGGIASPGIESMAERGGTSQLTTEIQAAIADGNAGSTMTGSSTNSPGVVNREFSIHRDFPLVTLVTMVAPSPDWFVGVSGLPLFQDGSWLDQVVVELRGLDAGTDSGPNYTSPDLDTQPRMPISELTGALFLNDGIIPPFGRFTFTRIDRP